MTIGSVRRRREGRDRPVPPPVPGARPGGGVAGGAEPAHHRGRQAALARYDRPARRCLGPGADQPTRVAEQTCCNGIGGSVVQAVAAFCHRGESSPHSDSAVPMEYAWRATFGRVGSSSCTLICRYRPAGLGRVMHLIRAPTRPVPLCPVLPGRRRFLRVDIEFRRGRSHSDARRATAMAASGTIDRRGAVNHRRETKCPGSLWLCGGSRLAPEDRKGARVRTRNPF
jgi:hypothetical protein